MDFLLATPQELASRFTTCPGSWAGSPTLMRPAALYLHALPNEWLSSSLQLPIIAVGEVLGSSRTRLGADQHIRGRRRSPPDEK